MEATYICHLHMHYRQDSENNLVFMIFLYLLLLSPQFMDQREARLSFLCALLYFKFTSLL